MNVPLELREEADAAALKWRATQPGGARYRISYAEEDAFSIGYQAGVMAWEAKVAKLNAVMNPK